ncbi:helix-turn-helix transcriptional regulator [Spirulina sp. CCNP1310]|nr:helix-turn-helix transcriptional regulator [Spirulina sp. CCNP1310]MEA5421538.1 helix-turn-helix transcriptional regulator [Spirulina sp. CCNP1310]
MIAARKDAKLTQQSIATALQKPQSFVAKYENGERRLDVVEFLIIAQAIGVNPCNLLSEIERKILEKFNEQKP